MNICWGFLPNLFYQGERLLDGVDSTDYIITIGQEVCQHFKYYNDITMNYITCRYVFISPRFVNCPHSHKKKVINTF